MTKPKVFNKKRAFKAVFWLICIFAGILILAAVTVFSISGYVRVSQKDRVFDTASGLPEMDDIDCIIVLGAGLQRNGKPSHMLEDRIKVGVEAFNSMGADYILMSGDRSSDYYDEPAAMKKYAEEMGVDPSKILIDNQGFSTFESVTRLKDEFGFDNVVVITQKYHLYRALYIAEDCEIDAIGVSADLRPYRNQFIRDIREVLARVKDFLMCI